MCEIVSLSFYCYMHASAYHLKLSFCFLSLYQCSVRVSNELGLGHSRATKYAVYVAVFQSLLIGILSMVVILVARDHITVLFTDSKEMQQAVSHLAWLLGITMVLNSVQPVISGSYLSLC